MYDRDTVTKGLECWSKMGAGICYRRCPYRPHDDEGMIVGECDLQTLCKDALELLKEQEAKTVLSPHIDRSCLRRFAEYIAYCPHCNQEILESHNRSYCGFCGKAVKWDV